MLNIIQLFKDQGINYFTKSKNSSPGWVNIKCPFCSDHSDHMGYNLAKGIVNCRRCGWHPLDATIATLTNTTIHLARKLIVQYSTGRPTAKTPDITPINRPSSITMPGIPLTMPQNTLQDAFILHNKAKLPLTIAPHYAYLKKRGFTGDNLSQLIETYGLHGTGPIGKYNYRIIAPIYFDGNLVSYQGRDYTGKASLRYMACPKSEEIRDHKDCLYAMDLVRGNTVIVVEGIFDAWKLGAGAVATFGIQFTWKQVRLLMERWNRRIIMYDKAAHKEAAKLANALSAYPGETFIASINDYKDPGELTVEKGREIMKKIKGA